MRSQTDAVPGEVMQNNSGGLTIQLLGTNSTVFFPWNGIVSVAHLYDKTPKVGDIVRVRHPAGSMDAKVLENNSSFIHIEQLGVRVFGTNSVDYTFYWGGGGNFSLETLKSNNK